MNPKQNRYTHLTKVKFIIKFLKTNDKEKILEGVRKKKGYIKKRVTRITIDLLSETARQTVMK